MSADITNFDNYLISTRFILFFIIEITLSTIGALSIVGDYLSNPIGMDWIFNMVNAYVTIIWILSLIIGIFLGYYPLRKVSTRLNSEKEIALKPLRALILLCPPYFLVATLGAIIILALIPSLNFIRGIALLYGLGFGLLVTRVLFFLYESRTWNFELASNNLYTISK